MNEIFMPRLILSHVEILRFAQDDREGRLTVFCHSEQVKRSEESL